MDLKLKCIPVFHQVPMELKLTRCSHVNKNEVFYFGKYAAWYQKNFPLWTVYFLILTPCTIKPLGSGNMTSGVICVFAEEIWLLFHSSHFLLRENYIYVSLWI